MSKTDSSSPGPRQELEHYYDCHNGCCLVYIGNNSNLDRNHICGHCTYITYIILKCLDFSYAIVFQYVFIEIKACIII